MGNRYSSAYFSLSVLGLQCINFKLRVKTASRKDTMPKASHFVPNKQLDFLFFKQNTLNKVHYFQGESTGKA